MTTLARGQVDDAAGVTRTPSTRGFRPAVIPKLLERAEAELLQRGGAAVTLAVHIDDDAGWRWISHRGRAARTQPLRPQQLDRVICVTGLGVAELRRGDDSSIPGGLGSVRFGSRRGTRARARNSQNGDRDAYGELEHESNMSPEMPFPPTGERHLDGVVCDRLRVWFLLFHWRRVRPRARRAPRISRSDHRPRATSSLPPRSSHHASRTCTRR